MLLAGCGRDTATPATTPSGTVSGSWSAHPDRFPVRVLFEHARTPHLHHAASKEVNAEPQCPSPPDIDAAGIQATGGEVP